MILPIQAAVARKRDPLRGTADIALAVGNVINEHKGEGVAKHFDLDITDAAFSFAQDHPDRRGSRDRRRLCHTHQPAEGGL